MVYQLISGYESIDEVVWTSSQFVVEMVKDESPSLNDFDLETLVAIAEDGPSYRW